MSLINNMNELRPHLPVAYSTNLTNMPPFDSAENDFLVPVLGNELYQTVVDAAAAQPSGAMVLLIDHCRAVIAPFAFVDNLPFLQTMITNNGLQALEAQDTRKAFKWEYNNVIAALEKIGYSCQEKLILFLDAHREDFPDWADSPYNADNGIGLIRSGADLRDIVGLFQPHRCFLKMKPLLETVVLMHLLPVFGEEFYDSLNTRLLNGDTSEQDKQLARLMRPMLARRTLEYAAVELSISFNGSAFTVTDERNKDIADEGRKAASDVALLRFREQMAQTATFFQEQAIKYLNATASATVFPEYFNSNLYPKQPTEIGADTRNAQFTGLFVL